MKKFSLVLVLVALFVFLIVGTPVLAQTATKSSSPSASPVITPIPEATPRPDLTQKSEETLGPLEKILESQELGNVWPFNPVKYAIRGAVGSGVPANTIVLLLLLPVVATIIAASRHLIGLRGFGIFLPAALAVTFVATGTTLGIGLFLVIVSVSTVFRVVSRRLKLKLQYLPRMALILWLVCLSVLMVLFVAPVIKSTNLTNVSIFPVLILALLAEDFARVQLGKSVATAITLTTETLILSVVSYFFLTLTSIQTFALLNPEIVLLTVAVIDVVLGKYVGLRLVEFWRFRKLIKDA